MFDDTSRHMESVKMSNDDLLRAAHAVIGRVSDPHVEMFASLYPKLHQMCAAAAADASQAATVRQVLPMMLTQLQAIETSKQTPDDASKTVYDHLNARYVDHLVPPPPPQPS